jgi:hypothetical protein
MNIPEALSEYEVAKLMRELSEKNQGLRHVHRCRRLRSLCPVGGSSRAGTVGVLHRVHALPA